MSDGGGIVRRHTTVRPEDLPSNHGVVAFLSHQKRLGSWQLAPETRVVSVVGQAELDLREADLSGGESTIEIFCVLGGVEIIVPPGVRVLNEGDSIAGSFEMKSGDWETLPGSPTIRITGNAYLGSVEIFQRAYGESARDARRRIRRSRRG